MKTRTERALEHALAWWDAVSAMDESNGFQGVVFGDSYIPKWVGEARVALTIAANEKEIAA